MPRKIWKVAISPVDLDLKYIDTEDDLGAPLSLEIEEKVIEYDRGKASDLLDEIYTQMWQLEKYVFEPKYLILGTKQYEILAATLSYHNASPVFERPTEFNGMEIVVIPGNFVKVVTKPGEEFLFEDKIRKEDADAQET